MWLPVLLDQREAVVPGVVAVVGRPAMDDDGEFGCSREFHLTDKDVLLDLARRVVVIVVEADFSPGNDFQTVGELLKLIKIGLSGQFGFMRMNADRGVDEVVLFGDFDRTIERAGTIAGSDG